MMDLERAFPPQTRRGRVLRWPLKFVRPGGTMRVLIGPARGCRWVVGAGIAGCWLGTYEWIKQKRLSKVLKPGMCFWDVGANAGFYSLMAGRCVGPQGRVEAFEPSPANLAVLQAHIEMNRMENIRFWPVAISDFEGTALFDSSHGSMQGKLDATGQETVSVVTIDCLAQRGGASMPQVLKIDVEGAETAVLRGGERFFRAERPVIFLSLHGSGPHRDCCALLQQWGFRLESLQPGVPIESTEEIIAWGAQ